MGKASWRIMNKHMEHSLVSGTNFVPGGGKDQSSHRSKVTGMLRIVVFVTLVVEFFHLEEGQIEVVCGGIEALWVTSKEYKVPNSGYK
jgi:hypothetical protein